MTPQQLADLDRRLRALERGRQAPHTNVDAGALRVTGGGSLAVVGTSDETILQVSAAEVGIDVLRAGVVLSESIPRLLGYAADELILHVDPDGGDDDNDGLLDPDTGAIAWLQTVQRAFDLIPEVVAGTVRVRILDTSTVAEDVYMLGIVGGGFGYIEPCDANGDPTGVEYGDGTGHVSWDGTLHVQGVTMAEFNIDSVWLDDPGNPDAPSDFATLQITASSLVQVFECRVNANGHRFTCVNARSGSHVILRRCTRINNPTTAAINVSRLARMLIDDCEGRGAIGVRGDDYSAVHIKASGPTGSSSNTSALDGSTITTQSVTFTTGTQDSVTVKPRRFTYSANGSRSYRHSKFVGWRDDDRVPRQGNYGYGTHSGWWFYPDATIRSDLAGLTIARVEAYVYRQARGGQAAAVDTKLYAHAHSSQPSGAPSRGGSIPAPALKWGQGKWFDLPQWVGQGLRDGNVRGIAVYATTRALYGLYGTGARLRVTTN